MKRIKPTDRRISRVWTLTVTTLLVVALPLLGIAGSQSDSTAEISDEKLEAIARAYIEVYKVNQSYKSRIDAAESTEEANELQQAANQAMIDIIEGVENVTVNEYNDVIQALGDDDELRERLQAQVDAIQEEESEKD